MPPTLKSDIATNRKASRDFHILDKYEAGIELKGTEVKSIRAGHININDAFARIDHGQCRLFGCDIQPYEKAGFEQHEAKAVRRLLLHKNEIKALVLILLSRPSLRSALPWRMLIPTFVAE